MLPFTVIPFVRSKDIQDSSVDNSCNPSNSDSYRARYPEAYPGSSSAEFYSLVISESSSGSSHSHTPARLQKNKRRKEITPSSYKNLYNKVCNDDIVSVKDWFTLYFPEKLRNDDHVGSLQTAVKSLCDESGCNIAMTAAVHKSYESFKYLLNFFPSLMDGKDNFGNTFSDVVWNVKDENLNRILSKYSMKLRTTAVKLESAKRKSEEYCKQCNLLHCDPNHESSISHLHAENRDVPEINPHLDPNNAGYKMMSKFGWSENKGLGPSEAGRKYLIKTQLKTDRRGLGIPEKNKPKVSHFEPHDVTSLKDNLLHKRKIKLTTESKRKRKKDQEKSRRWEID